MTQTAAIQGASSSVPSGCWCDKTAVATDSASRILMATAFPTATDAGTAVIVPVVFRHRGTLDGAASVLDSDLIAALAGHSEDSNVTAVDVGGTRVIIYGMPTDRSGAVKYVEVESNELQSALESLYACQSIYGCCCCH